MAGIAPKTDPALWAEVKAAVTAAAEGGEPGQWSARKAQHATAEYQKRGGGYLGRKRADNHLAAWTREDKGKHSDTTAAKGGDDNVLHAARKPAASRRHRTTGKDKGMGETHQHLDITAEFRRLVNITAAELRRWLDTWESQAVGFTREGEEEAVGHRSGRRILELLEDEGDDAVADAAFRYEVVGYIHRHLAQRPDGDVTDTRWRHSLMNWGHDPMRDSSESTAMTDDETKAPMTDPNGAQDAATTPAPRKPRARRATAAADAPAPVRKPRTAKPAAEAKPASSKSTKAGAASTARRSAAAPAKRAAGKATTKRAPGTAAKRTAAPAKRVTATTTKRATAPTTKRAATPAKGATSAKRGAVKRPAATTAKRAAPAKRGAAAPAKRAPAAPAKRATPAKRPAAAATKSATGTAAKRNAAPKRGTPAVPKRTAAAAPKRATAKAAAPKRAPAKAKPAARGAAGRTTAAAKGGRSSSPRNRG